MNGKNKIYVSSRMKHAELWRSCRGPFNIIASWIDETEVECFEQLWQRMQNEIKEADAIVFLAEKGDAPFKDVLIECGMALSMGKPVFVACKMETEDESRAIGSWLHHPLVTLYQTEDALDKALVSAATGKTAYVSAGE